MKKHLYTSALFFILVLFQHLPALAQWYSTKLTQGRQAMAIISADNKAIFAGGYYTSNGFDISTNRVDIYDGVTNQLTTAALSVPRHSIGTTRAGNLVFFAGGQDGLGVYQARMVSNIDIYNTTTNQWTTAMLTGGGRSNVAVASAGGKVLFAGGTQFYFYYTNIVDIYDIATNKWSVTQLPGASQYMRATSVGNKILFSFDDSPYYIYDVLTGQWATSTTQISKRGSTVTTIGNKAFFAGGNDNTNVVDIYDANTNQWTTAKLSQGRSLMKSISLGNKAFFAGGTNGTASNQVDIYDASTDQWTTAQLSQARYSIAATSIDNKVFFAGGSNNSTVVDIYDETTGQWSITQLPKAKGSVSGLRAGERALFVELSSVYPNNSSGIVDIYTTNSALPVNLISFSGVWTENVGTQLTWQTSLETNNDHFEIQRSENAKSFETIGRVQGKGTVEARTDYNFTDPDMPGQIGYYRLKQVDFDASAHFSKVISVNRRESIPLAASLAIWPVPATGILNLKLSTNKVINQVTVYDLQGRQRLATQIENQSTADVSGLPAGIYLLDVLTTDGQRLHKHFLKQ